MCRLVLAFVVCFAITVVTTGSQIQQSATCAPPLQSADKTFTIFDSNDEPAEGERVPTGGYVNLQCANGYLFSDGSNASVSICRPTTKGEWHPAIKPCLRVCPPLETSNVQLTCKYNDHEIGCIDSPLFSGTEIKPRCKELHHVNQDFIPDYTTILCRSDGSWNKKLFRCDPDCGIPKHTPLIAGGSNATLGQFPWHVAIYSIPRGHLLICSGTLIAPNIILSAAHCFYNESFGVPLTEPTDYAIVVGKLTRNYTTVDGNAQKRLAVSEILFSEKPYDPKSSGYMADIALVILKERVNISPYVLPACFRAYRSLGFNPGPGILGTLSGWGLDESDQPTEMLKFIQLPFVHYNQCLKKLPGVTHDKFCAGADQGPRPRSGDSGGGLVFKDPNNNFYYIRGIVSTTERFSEAAITSFTDISYYQDWMDKIIHKNRENQISVQTETRTEYVTPVNTFRTTSTTTKKMTTKRPTSSVRANVCPPLQPSNVDLTCRLRRKIIDCNSSLMNGTEVTPSCKPLHYISPEFDPDYTTIRCLGNGRWESTLYKCVSDCGISTSQTSVSSGNEAKLGQLPWHVAIYSTRAKDKQYVGQHGLICGGTLITKNMVLTAAQCFYDEALGDMTNDQVQNYYVVVGKITRNIKTVDSGAQKTFQISEILLFEKPYNPGETSSSSLNIAMVILKESITIGPYVLPACFQKLTHSGFNPGGGVKGMLGGWELDETGKSSEGLKLVQVPFVKYEDCIRNVSHVTLDTFCVGAGQGTFRPPNGYKGAGIVFKNKNNNKYYLRGVFNFVGKENTNMSVCTDISYYDDWIQAVIRKKPSKYLASIDKGEPHPQPETTRIIKITSFDSSSSEQKMQDTTTEAVHEVDPFSMAPTYTGGGKVDLDLVLNELHEQYEYVKRRSKSVIESALKSNIESVNLRNAGHDEFKKGRDHRALELYTKSVAFAFEGSEELALAYASRSAILLRTFKYVPCLNDINRALRGQCPESVKTELQGRKKECWLQIGRASESDRKLKRVRADDVDPIIVANSEEESEWRRMCKLKNTLIPNASTKIKIENDDKWGRHIVATKDIGPGEILSWQEFSVMTVAPTKQYENCSFCLSRCYALIPCPSCISQMYCSECCRKEAHDCYHRTECRIMSFVVSSKTEFDFLQLAAVRMLLIGTKQGAQLNKVIENLTAREFFANEVTDDPTNKPFAHDYLSVLKLCQTFNPFLVRRNVTFAVQAIILLQKVAFFGDERVPPTEDYEKKVPLTETELLTAMILINHIVSVGVNKLSVLALNTSDITNVERVGTNMMGAGVCPFHSLISHSCDPNVRFFTRNRKQVLVSVRPIKKSEQIFYSYCAPFSSSPIEQRKKDLAYFGFTCKCEACVKKWPLESVLRHRRLEFLNDKQEATVPLLTEMIQSIAAKNEIIELGNDEILQVMCDIREWFHTNVKPPSISALRCENCILDFLMLMFDDYSREFMNTHSKEGLRLALIGINNQTISKIGSGRLIGEN